VAGDARRAGWQLQLWVAAANLTGAFTAFLYFTFIDLSGRAEAAGTTGATTAFFVVGFAVIAAIGIALGNRWARPISAPDPDIDDPVVRHRALLMPWAVGVISIIGWSMASVVWGVILPAIVGTLSWRRFLHTFVGTTLISGSITVLFTFLAVEQTWRRRLPNFFPRGDLSEVRSVPRLRVRLRLLAVFLLIALVPLGLMTALTLSRAHLMLAAERDVAAALLHDMVVAIVFLLAIGTAAAVGLALFVSRSVAAPLADVEAAMERVGRGDLETRAPVVSNDEIGAVAEGFNRMVSGLRERERIRETFGKYVSPEVRDEILAGRVTLGGQVREVTILFSDLRDFTPWVESQPPDEVVRDINAYFTLMEGAIRAHGGLVVQFIGDEIEAVFGAPVPEPHHADRAVAAALDMCRRLEEWNESRRAAGRIMLRHGIGIHTGEVIAASIGSPERLSYALVGDPVNLASRIQGLTKEVGGVVLVSGDTVRRLKDPMGLEALPAVRVRGRLAEVEVYRAA
jgi:adenylate cyclase